MADQNCFIATTSDIDFISSVNDSIENTSSDDNPNKAIPSDNNCEAVLLLNNDLYEETIEIDKDDDIVSLSSSVSSINESIQVDDECAVLLCNYYVRSQFDKVFFINFPKNNTNLRAKWWKICSRSDKFDPLSKICSIHFTSEDFIIREQSRAGQRYRQTVLAYPGVIPTLFVHASELTQYTRNQIKKPITNRKEVPIQSAGLKCVVQSCKNNIFKNNTNMLLFKFPLGNKELLKDWVNNIDLVNFQPLKTDRVCSDHFQNYDIAKINNKFILNKYAIPSIKPTHPYVINPKHKKSKAVKLPIKNKKIDVSFESDSIEFCKVNENVIMVKDSKNKGATDLLSSLENNNKNLQQNSLVHANSANVNDNNEIDLYQQQLIYMDVLSNDNVTEIQLIENKDDSVTKKESVIENSNNDNVNLEYVYMDALKNENIVEIQPKMNSNQDLKNEHKKKKLVDVSSISAVNNISMKFSSNELKNRSRMKSTERNIPTDKYNKTNSVIYSTMPASNTSVKRKSTDKCITKYKYIKTELPSISRISTFGDKFKKSQIKLTKQNISNEIPKSIVLNKQLTDTYGEMLPPYCNSDCKLQCYYHIPDPERKEIFDEFYKSGNVTTQNWKITQLVQLNTVELEDGNIKKSQSYSLIMDQESMIVCRTFFINTLGVPESRLDAVLIPNIYNWYSLRYNALQSNQLKPIKNKPLMTNFVRNSLPPLLYDYNLYEPESDEETTLDNVPKTEFEKVVNFIKSIPRVLSKYQDTKINKNQFFETSIHIDNMYKMYLDNYIKDNIPPPCTRQQFKKVYNQYMKTFFRMV